MQANRLGLALRGGLRGRWRQIADLLAVAAIGVILLAGYRSIPVAAVVVPYPHDLGQVTFAVAGDVIPHQAVREASAAAGTGADGWAALFGDVSDVFHGVDFAFVNLETPVAPAHSHGSKPFMFDAPVVLLDGLKASNIKIVSFANNHVMDQGWPGFAETREHLRDQGLLFSGTGDTAQQAWQPVITRGQRHQGRLARHDPLAQRQPQPRQGRSAARQFLPISRRIRRCPRNG